jgi:cytochrome c-type biogenesis protein CcmF
MEYVGEHLLVGKIGNLFVILSFVLALLASISYYFAAKEDETSASWKSIARLSFRLHSISVLGIVVTLFIMLQNHYFEYEYVWHHSSKAMPMRYILSCFWEGQEGSFLLWSFWHVILGLILQLTSKKWEAPVMSVISIVQAFLASMLLGIFIFDYRIGSNPFTVLLREHPDFANIPLFTNPDYLEKLDGRGLNPLLQNYWMTIHPPTLFLGFASTVIPFAYAIAGLWKKRFSEWITPALPWAFFSVMILGTGVLMGGAWAYEALSFGGFWAWDPVENASLVPWLILVGAAHLMLINRNNPQSLFATFFLTALTFIFILYSTFLTRSGILGETSVHAFTDLGMSGQLLIYLLFFLLLSIYLIVKNRKLIPSPKEEEALWSREFWMFVGAVVLLISSFQITLYTSMPVWNKLFGLNKAPIKDAVNFYNTWQLPFAVVTTLLIAVGQFFKYKNTNGSEFIKKISVSFFSSVVIALLLSYVFNYFNQPFYALLLFSSVFAFAANTDYLVRVLKGNIKKAGASVAHIGFALMMIGVLISTSKKEIISQNSSGKSIESLGEKFSNNDNILLTQKDTLPMGKYFVSYKGKRFVGANIYFDVDYFSKDEKGKYKNEFTLSPIVQTNPMMGNVAEPDTRHYLTYDVYTHVTYAVQDNLNKNNENKEEYTPPKEHLIKEGDTIFSSNALIILDSLSTKFDRTAYHIEKSAIAAKAYLRVLDVSKHTYKATPIYYIENNIPLTKEAVVDELGLKFSFDKIEPDKGKVVITLREKSDNIKDFIVMQAMIFPYINVLWIGCIIMIIGTVLAIVERVRKKAGVKNAEV